MSWGTEPWCLAFSHIFACIQTALKHLQLNSLQFNSGLKFHCLYDALTSFARLWATEAELCFPYKTQPVVLQDWVVKRNIFCCLDKPSRVRTELAWSSVLTEEKVLLCLQIKRLVLTQTVILAQLEELWSCERRKGETELLKPVLLSKVALPKAAPCLGGDE